MIKLTHKKTLEFYDVPQIFVAIDIMGVNYLCVLYSEDKEYEYLGVRISQMRLNAYLAGQLDLRMAYTQPEQEGALFTVMVKEQAITATAMLRPEDVTEDMLPAPGFYNDPQGALDDDTTDTLQLCIPKKDSNLLAEIVHRMGWTASSIQKSMRKIAVL